MISEAIHATAAGEGIAIAHGGPGDIRVSFGLAVDLDAFEAFARKHDIQQRALDGFFQTILNKRVPLDKAEGALNELASLHIQTRAELQQLRPYGDASRLRAQAAAALEDGRIEEADALLQRVANLAAANAQAAQLAVLEAIREQARTAALQGNLRLMKLDYTGAAAAYRAALTMLPAGDDLVFGYLLEIARAERRAGCFDAAIEAANHVLSGATPPAVAAAAWQERGKALRDTGRYREAAESMNKAVFLLERDSAEGLAEARIDAASLLVDQGRLDEAAQALAALTESLSQAGDVSTRAQRTLASSAHALGRLQIEQGKWQDADQALAQALTTFAKILPPSHPDLIRIRSDLAYVRRRLGQTDEAVILYETALADFTRVFGQEHPEYVTQLDHFAGVCGDQGQWSRALDLYQEAILLGQKILGPSHPDMGQAWNNIGTVQQELGNVESARAAFENASHILSESLGEKHPDTATAWHNLAGTLLQLGEIDRAEVFCEKAFAVRRAVLGKEHQAIADSLTLRAALLQTRGEQAAALLNQEAAHSILSGTLGNLHERTIKALTGLTRLHLENGSPGKAVVPARAALFAARRTVPHRPALLGMALNNLGNSLYALGKSSRAIFLLEAGLEAYREAHSTDHPDVAMALMNLAAVIAASGQDTRARALNIEAIELGERLWPAGHQFAAVALNNLAKIMERSNDADQAGPLYSQAIEILERVAGPENLQTKRVMENFSAWQKNTHRFIY